MKSIAIPNVRFSKALEKGFGESKISKT